MGQEGIRKITDGPQEHHQPRQAICLFLLPVIPYLRYQLYAPEDSAYCTQDISGDGNTVLGCHVGTKLYALEIAKR